MKTESQTQARISGHAAYNIRLNLTMLTSLFKGSDVPKVPR